MAEIILSLDGSQRHVNVIRSLIPSSHGDLRPRDGVHAVITIANVRMVCVGFMPAIPTPVTDHTIARNVLVSASSCLRR